MPTVDRYVLRSRVRRGLLAVSVGMAAGLLAGCPPVGPATQPGVVVRASDLGPPPVVGVVPDTAGIFTPLPETDVLTGQPLVKGLMTREQVVAEVQRSTSETQSAPSPASQSATQQGGEEGQEPPPMAVRFYLQGLEKYNEGANAEAIEYLDKALRIDPHAFTVLRLMGRVCFASNQLARGSLYLQRAASLRPEDVEVNYLLGLYWRERREWPTALKYLLAADASPARSVTSPLTVATSFHLARTLQAAGYHLAAARQFEEFLTLLDQPVPSFRYDRDLNFLLDQEWAVHLAAAENYYEVGKFEVSLPHYREALSHNPRDVYVAGRLVAALARAGQTSAAIRQAVETMGTAQASDETVALLIWAYGRAGEAERLITDLKAEAAAGRGGAATVLAVATLQDKAGRPGEAIETLRTYQAGHADDLTLLGRIVRLAIDHQAYRAGFEGSGLALHAAPARHDEILKIAAPLLEGAAAKAVYAQFSAAGATPPATPEGDYLLALAGGQADAPESAVERWFQEAIRGAPTFWPARERYLGLLLRQENFGKATELITEAIAGKQGGAKPTEMLIESEAAQQRYANALDIAKRAKEKYPDSAEIRLQLATIYRVRRQDAEEQAELLEVTRRFPKLEAGYRRLMELALRPRHHQPDLEADVLRRMSQNLPGNRFALLMTARYLAETGREDEAEQIVQRLMAEQPDDPEAVILQARVLETRKQGAAIKLLEEVVGKTTTPPAGLVGALLELYRSDKRESDATALALKLYRANPDSALWAVVYAGDLVLHDQKAEAETVLRQAVAKNPKSQDMVMELAQFLAGNDRAADGAALLRKFMDDNGTTAERLYLLSGLQEKAEEEDKCRATLRQVLAIMPDHTGANNDLGYFMADRGMKLDEAETLVSKALVQEPNNGSFLDSLGWVYYKQGRFSQAISQLERASAATDGGEPEVLQHLGDALYRSGRKVEAAERWRQAAGLLESVDGKELAKIKQYVDDALKRVDAGKEPVLSPLGKDAPEKEKKPSPESQP